MTDVVLSPVTSGYNVNRINANFDALKNKLNDEVLHSSGGSNTMDQDLDMNSNNLLNIGTLDVDTLNINGILVVPGDVTALPAGSISSTLIADSAITSGKLATGSVTSAKLADGSVSTAKVASLAITDDKIASGVDPAKINFIQNGLSATIRSVKGKLLDFPISPQDFGAVGDGVTNDTAAVLLAVTRADEQGRTLNWGTSDKVYRITSTITYNFASRGFSWVSDGASIKFDPASPMREVVQLTVTGGFCSIKGKLALDANDKAFIGFYLSNSTDGSLDSYYGDFIASDLTVKNVYRSSTAFSGGDGIFIRGAWNKVILDRPDVRNCHMADGAEISGSQGIFGITVSNLGSASFKYCSITDPIVDGIFSDNVAVTGDQDGIRVFDGGEDVSRLYPWETYFEIRGGHIRNHRNRGVKIQCNFGRVSGTKFYRDSGYFNGTSQREIDTQVGGCSIEDIECLYAGTSAPQSVVFLSDSTNVGKKIPSYYVNNIKVVNASTATITVGVTVDKGSSNPSVTNINNVDILGAVTRFMTYEAWGSDEVLFITGVTCSPTTDFVLAGDSAGSGNQFLKASFSRCINRSGSLIPLFNRSAITVRSTVSAQDCYGFTDAPRVSNSDLIHPAILRVNAIGGTNDPFTGIMRPYSTAGLTSGSSLVLPTTGMSSSSSLILVTVGGVGATSQAILACSSAGVSVVSGSDWVGGTTSEPATGNWRAWYNGSSITLKNNSGTSRAVTAYIFG